MLGEEGGVNLSTLKRFSSGYADLELFQLSGLREAARCISDLTERAIDKDSRDRIR